MRLLTLCLPLLLCACPPPDKGAHVDDEEAPAAQGNTPSPPDVPQAKAPSPPVAPNPNVHPAPAAQGNTPAPAPAKK